MMIEVNLLPTDMRRVEHTPLPRFMTIIIGTALVMATAAFGVIINLRKVPDLNAKQAALVKDIGISQPTAAAYDKLQDEISDARSRKQAIAEIWRTRIIWSRKLSQLAQMTPPGVGLTSIKLEESRSSGSRELETGGTLTLESILAGSDLDRVANWRRICEGTVRITNVGEDVGKSFYSSFMDLLPTETTKVDVKEGEYVEKEALKVALKMPVKPPSLRQAEAVQAEQDKTKVNGGQAIPATDKPGRPARTAKPEPVSATTPADKPATPATPATSTDNTTKTPAASDTAAPVQDDKLTVSSIAR